MEDKKQVVCTHGCMCRSGTSKYPPPRPVVVICGGPGCPHSKPHTKDKDCVGECILLPTGYFKGSLSYRGVRSCR